MDTDDLSTETSHAVLIAAENFHHDLTLQFGLLSDDCKDDDEFLNKSQQMIEAWLKDLNRSTLIEDIFFDDPPGKTDFKKILRKILDNIEEVKKNPISRRKFEY